MNEHSFLSDALIYLAAAVVCVPVARHLRLGSVLGYLLAGCLLGPFALGLVKDSAAILHFAEIGVVLMLFVIGLELDPRHLWALRRSVFGGGSLQVVSAAVPLGLAALAFGLPWQAGVVVGFSLALSSTAVSMQTMGEKNLLGSPLGQSAFGVLLFQDMAAIPLLALVPLLAAKESAAGASGWLGVIQVCAAVGGVFVIGRFLTRPVLRLLAQSGQREVFSAFTLLLVLGIAALMASAGISMALGAFLAGVLLAGSEYRHALETDIEPFRGLLMGLFFMAVGMSIDFSLIAERPALVALVLIGFQVVKALALRVIAGPLAVAPAQRWLLAALLCQGSEFAFVVFGVARSARVLPGEWEALLTLAVALSMALTPLWLILYERLLIRVPARAPAPGDGVPADPQARAIIAGFGRFGQIVGRLLLASGFKATVLDHDPDQVDLLRRFGFDVQFGDATRLDLLRAAGAERAALLVVAIDDPETSLRLVDALREHFPRLPIVARARNVSHWQGLRTRGVSIVERETFESALLIGRKSLEALGVRAFEARERADLFRRHNREMLEQLLPRWQNQADVTAFALAARQQLEQQMERDRGELAGHGALGWHSSAGERTAAEARAENAPAPNASQT